MRPVRRIVIPGDDLPAPPPEPPPQPPAIQPPRHLVLPDNRPVLPVGMLLEAHYTMYHGFDIASSSGYTHGYRYTPVGFSLSLSIRGVGAYDPDLAGSVIRPGNLIGLVVLEQHEFPGMGRY